MVIHRAANLDFSKIIRKIIVMKNNSIWLLAFLIIMYAGTLSAQDAKIVDLGIFKNPNNHKELEVRLRPVKTVENGSYSAGIFTVRIPSEYGVTLTAVPGSSPYGYSFAGPVGQSNGYDYYRFQFSGSVHFVNWEKGVQYPLLSLVVNGDFPPNGRVKLVNNDEWTLRNNGDYYQELRGQELQRSFYYLPVNIKSFYAEPLANRTVNLKWEVESEEILAYSEIEYSVDGRDFDLIGKVPAHTKDDVFDDAYAHLHEKPVDVNFYRIRLTDINGEVTHTPIRVINFDNTDADFAVFPNPTSGPLTIASNNLINYKVGVSYRLIDNSGKIVQTDQVRSDNLNLDLSKLPAGVYFVEIFAGEEPLDKFKVILADN
jgi:hypothetical protein